MAAGDRMIAGPNLMYRRHHGTLLLVDEIALR